ncbi:MULTISPECIES: hypothetical protein [unclassified Streptomyces]|uniref:hypothetical protein n=1 Tax=unclassified Streptomyces TaxID=2593676 RepID=UPI000978EBC9|nr:MULTISPECIES: hypothetical protein [unclassified Streptomyces]ONI48650.1 hypothetical protein STIB_72040 [Streptomyces sp. IB2014 011-1]RDV48184.1 hypothetical protein DDV98_28865 [Streptomyces sp. IB2014 011-12]
MPTDPNHRALLKAVGSLTTQVKRIADALADGTAQDSFALAPPVVTDDDGAQTTSDDTERPAFEAVRAYIRSGAEYLPSTTVERNAMIWRAVHAALNAEDREADQLRTELARIRRALDPDDETYIRETVDDQLAMTATLNRVRTALADRPALCTDSDYERGWSDASEMVRHALDGTPK